MRRLTAGILGFAVASLISALMLSATTRLVEPFDIIARLGMVPVFLYFSGMAVILVAVPVFFLFLKFNLIHRWSVVAAGLVIGALMGSIVGTPSRGHVLDILFMAGVGAVSALAFWVVWKQGREEGKAGNM